jgi:hypothetical protein
MGIVRAGPPIQLIDALLHRFEIPNFVETGTYNGETAAWAGERFERVVTVELSPELHAQAELRLAAHASVEARLGRSRDVLAEVVPGLQGPALFWLDAHWSGDQTSGERDQCPLLDELAIVRRHANAQYVLIDDARMFMTPAPPPNDPDQWPSLREVLGRLSGDDLAEPVVVEDVVIAVPPAAASTLAEHCIAANARAWDEHLRSTVPSLRGGASLVRRGAGLALADVRKRIGGRRG